MKHFEPYFLTALVLLGFGLRLIGVADRPLDGDEGVILLIAHGNISHVLEAAARDVHPPLFHLLTSLALAIDEVSRLTLRSVSVLAGTVLVALGPALAHRFTPSRFEGLKANPSTTLRMNALLVTALLATSPFLIYLAQDARMYSLLACLAVGSWLLLLKVWDAEDEPFDQAQGTPPLAGWAGWAVVTLLMLLTHHLGWVVLFGEFVATLIWHRKTVHMASVQNWLGAGLLIVAGYLPILATTIDQVQGRLAETSLHLGFGQRIIDLVGAFYRIFAGRTFLALTPSHLLDLVHDHPLQFGLFLVTILVPFALAGMGKFALMRTERLVWRDWATLIGVPILVALAVASIADQAPRYLSFLAPFFLTLVAIGLQRIWPRWWGKLLALGLVATIGAGLWTQLQIHNRASGLDAYAQILRDQLSVSDHLLVRGSFAGGEVTAFRFEAQQLGLPTIDIASAEGGTEPGRLTVDDLFHDYTVGNLGELRAVSPAQRIDEGLVSFPKIWFFDTTYAPDPLAGLDPADRVTVQTLGFDKERQPLTLYLVEKPGSGR